MADDIVEQLRIKPNNQWMIAAADEIELLRAEVDLKGYRVDALQEEIEKLRAAGDALAAGISSGRWDDALDAWKDIRLG